MREALKIARYNPAWAGEYERYADDIDRVAGSISHQITHIGSTAIPGMDAKPIIDILVGLSSRSDLIAFYDRLLNAGYEPKEPAGSADDQRFLVRRGSGGDRKAHVHLALKGGRQWRDLIAFRNALRSDPLLARNYLALKRRLARKFPFDVDMYTSEKGEFVSALVARI